MLEQTLAILKPDVIERNLIGTFLSRIEAAGFKVVQARLGVFETSQVKAFYAMHSQRPFFESLVDSVGNKTVMFLILSGESAVERFRTLIGSTNPAQANPGTLRGDYGQNVEANSVHGSDSLDSAAREIALCFGSV